MRYTYIVFEYFYKIRYTPFHSLFINSLVNIGKRVSLGTTYNNVMMKYFNYL